MSSTDTPTPQRGAQFRSAQARNLRLLTDALRGVHISEAERASLQWLAGWEAHTVRHIAAVIARARSARPASFDELPGAPASAAYGGYGAGGSVQVPGGTA